MMTPSPTPKIMSRLPREVPATVFLLSLMAMILGVVWLIDATLK
jgi:hypothetical protein